MATVKSEEIPVMEKSTKSASPSRAGLDNAGFERDATTTKNNGETLSDNNKRTPAMELVPVNVKNGNRYYLPVNTHKKLLRGEKLYVTTDQRPRGASWRKIALCAVIWILIAVVFVVSALAATGVIFNTPATTDAQVELYTQANDSLEENDTTSTTTEATTTTILPSLIEIPPALFQSPRLDEPAGGKLVRGSFHVLNMKFSDDLIDHESIQFRSLQRNLENELYVVYRDTDIRNISVDEFSAGSVKVNFTLTWPVVSSMVAEKQAFNHFIRYLNHSGGFLGRFLVLMPSIEFYDEGIAEESVTQPTRSPDFGRAFDDDWSTESDTAIPNLWSILMGMNQTTPGMVTNMETVVGNDDNEISTTSTTQSTNGLPILHLHPFEEINETSPTTEPDQDVTTPVHQFEFGNRSSSMNDTLESDTPPTLHLHFFEDILNITQTSMPTGSTNDFFGNDATFENVSSREFSSASTNATSSWLETWMKHNSTATESTGGFDGSSTTTTNFWMTRNDVEEVTTSVTTENDETNSSEPISVIGSVVLREPVGSVLLTNESEVTNSTQKNEAETAYSDFLPTENSTTSVNNAEEEYAFLKPMYRYNWNETILYSETMPPNVTEPTEQELNQTTEFPDTHSSITTIDEFTTIEPSNISEASTTTDASTTTEASTTTDASTTTEASTATEANTVTETSTITVESTISSHSTEDILQLENTTSEVPEYTTDFLEELLSFLDESVTTSGTTTTEGSSTTDSNMTSSDFTNNLNLTVPFFIDDSNLTIPSSSSDSNVTDLTSANDLNITNPATTHDLNVTELPTTSDSNVSEFASRSDFNTTIVPSAESISNEASTSTSSFASFSTPSLEKSYEWTEETIHEVRIGPSENATSSTTPRVEVTTMEITTSVTTETSTSFTTNQSSELPVSTENGTMAVDQQNSTNQSEHTVTMPVDEQNGTNWTTAEPLTSSESSNTSEGGGGEVSYGAEGPMDEPKEEETVPESPVVDVVGDFSENSSREHSWLDVETTTLQNEISNLVNTNEMLNQSETTFSPPNSTIESSLNLETSTTTGNADKTVNSSESGGPLFSTSSMDITTTTATPTTTSESNIRVRRRNRRWRIQ